MRSISYILVIDKAKHMALISIYIIGFILFFGNVFLTQKTKGALINYQNNAETNFKKNKGFRAYSNYIIAYVIFILITVFAQIKMPYSFLRGILKSKGEIVNGTAENIEKTIKSNKVVIINFWGEWCGPCELMVPSIEEFSRKHKYIKVIKVHALQKKILKKHKVKGIPQTLLLQDGVEVKRWVGAMTLKDLEQFINI